MNWFSRKEPPPTPPPKLPTLQVCARFKLERGECLWWPKEAKAGWTGMYLSLNAGPYRAEALETSTGFVLVGALFRTEAPLFRAENAHVAIKEFERRVRENILTFARLSNEESR